MTECFINRLQENSDLDPRLDHLERFKVDASVSKAIPDLYLRDVFNVKGEVDGRLSMPAKYGQLR